ncbi:hypothetical protein B0H14DRAFT_2848620 [Mycena olivaceomarginata]|nr:hypothetical protein B0H14DRAFT_2848620 [Mycena olivaceomarginata]
MTSEPWFACWATAAAQPLSSCGSHSPWLCHPPCDVFTSLLPFSAPLSSCCCFPPLLPFFTLAISVYAYKM